MRRILSGLVLAVLLLPTLASAHCEVPCGIFDDALRIEMLREHVTTIEKSMNQIQSLSAEEDPDYNQLVRWVTTKKKALRSTIWVWRLGCSETGITSEQAWFSSASTPRRRGSSRRRSRFEQN